MSPNVAARRYWLEAYDAIPKSIFAVLAWHLANCAFEDGTLVGCIAELNALGGQIIDKAQADRAAKAILKIMED